MNCVDIRGRNALFLGSRALDEPLIARLGISSKIDEDMDNVLKV